MQEISTLIAQSKNTLQAVLKDPSHYSIYQDQDDRLMEAIRKLL